MSILKAIIAFVTSIFSYIFSWFKGGATTAAKAAANAPAEPAKSSSGVMSWLMAILGWFGQGFKQCLDHPVTFTIVGAAFAGGWFLGFDMASKASGSLVSELAAAKKEAAVSNATARALQARLASLSTARAEAPVVAPQPLISAPVAPKTAPVELTPLPGPKEPVVVAPAPVPAKKPHHKKEASSSSWDPATWNWHKYWQSTTKQ